MKHLFLLALSLLLLITAARGGQDGGPLRVLFLGHDAEHHNSNEYYPMLAKALGRDAIYFDYHTSVSEALGDFDYLSEFDAVLLYANHEKIDDTDYANLTKFINEGGGFIPVHCASACFHNQPEFIKLVGGRFESHKTGVFTASIINPEHPAMQGVTEFEAWDETYRHDGHAGDRTILMVRKPSGTDDNITEPEPWTWTRDQGKGRVFYTASGHDQRAWSQPAFHQLLKSGIVWAVGDARKSSYETFISTRAPLQYEKRDNIPNYEKRPKPLDYQLPLSPENSLKYTQAPVGWKLELFASEPDIINPIAIAWDERGRLWVAETIDYPNEVKPGNKGDDKIKILEDTDGDGRCDKVTVFADGLNIPTSLTFSNGGLIVHQAPVTLFLKDTDGDDRADVREVLIDGWGPKDTHAGPSNLRYGLDNQIYGTVGYSAFDGTVGGKHLRFGMGVYRFTPDATSMEFLHQFNNNTWGLGFNDAGDVFGSTANNNPSFFGGIPATAYPDGKGLTAKAIASSPTFYPITPNIRQVDVFGGYTAGAGHAIANSDGFPEAWRGKMAFVCGPTGDLLGKFKLQRDGAGFKAKNDFSLVPSADEWFSPVAAEVGPDGNLWIADWYNFIIQHNPTPNRDRGGYDAETGMGNAHINPNRDRQHGRIYRLVWEKAPAARITSLATADTAKLVSALTDPNQFWRLTAQRLLVQDQHTDAGPALKKLAQTSAPAAIHALWTLHGLDQLDPETHRQVLLSKDPAVRRNAVRALPADSSGTALIFESGVINDPDLTTRLAAFVTLVSLPSSEALKNAIGGLIGDPTNQEDPWLSAALGAAAKKHGVTSTSNFAPAPENLLATAKWTPTKYAGEGKQAKLPNQGHQGGPCLRIMSGTGADFSFQSVVAVKPDTRYRLKGMIRTQGIKGAAGALFNVHGLTTSEEGRKLALQGDHPWTPVSFDFDTGPRDSIAINALFGGWGRSTGTAWFDDISLHELIPVQPESKTATGAPVGDVARGKIIFDTHQVAACNRCHQLNGEGGVIGPALDGIGASKDADYLRQSLVDPGAVIAEGYPGPASPMPPMDLLLNPQEIEDILAYIKSLK